MQLQHLFDFVNNAVIQKHVNHVTFRANYVTFYLKKRQTFIINLFLSAFCPEDNESD
jgi:hypothetical protein